MSKPEHTESPAGAPAGSPAAELDGGAAAASGQDAAAGPARVPKARSAAAADTTADASKPASADGSAGDAGSRSAGTKPGRRSASGPTDKAADDPKPGSADGSAADAGSGSADVKPAAVAADSASGSAGKAAGDSKSGSADGSAGDAGSGPADVKPAAVAADSASGSAGKAADDPKSGSADGKVDGAKAGKASLVKAGSAAEAATASGAVGKDADGGSADDGKDRGRLLARRYRLGAVLGKGGMGTVWRAEDEVLGRTVAVKELRFSTGVDEDEKRRLITRTLREAKAIARIRSEGAVTVFDVVDEDGRPWIVMELVEGASLAEFVRENGPLTPRRAAEVGLAVLDVLRAAHGQGILHRDVKPSNVLIAASGRVVLTDFGIAQVEGDPSITSTGMLVGAPSYISPERARGQKPGPPADMWSLGGLLYAAVEGVPPYDKGSALATLTAVMTEPVDPPKNAGPLTEIIYGLLVKDPAGRLDDDGARAMLTAVLNAPDPEPEPEPEPVPPVEETRAISLSKADAEAEKAAEKAAKKERERRDREQRERTRAALKSARKAAAAAAAAPPARPAPVKAPLTDVMSRRTIVLAIAGVVVVLAVLGTLIGYLVSGGDKDSGRKNEGKGGPTPVASGAKSPGGQAPASPPAASPAATPGSSPSAGASPAASGGAPSGDPGQGQSQGQGQGQDAGQGQSSQGQGTSPGNPGGALPAGFSTVTDLRYHFSMGMPEGFHQTDTAGQDSGAIYSRDGGFPRIQVDYTDSPGSDARAAWLEIAPGVAGSSKGYHLVRLESVDYRGYPTVADWEFEREQKGVKVRVLDRGFRMDAKHGYAIMITCAADQWDGPECTQLRNTAFQTFQSLG
ncbi:serine/threonine-protein kinase [Streptomyces sp. SPB4]|uniref:serine/threonine-protein kinase n=1 Tax=Streptomyces sp. SPB4 TaxID=2940553 RepID=UPI0024759011|nr:serine/threonine-protein kinase [Streptomyces sp. SPB4]MDH6541558.1 serine/threonine protein kinase [Streptomyces sp. SPB4]